MQQYNELSSWLGTVLQKAKRQSSCLSEKYVNQVEAVLDAWPSAERQLTLKPLELSTHSSHAYGSSRVCGCLRVNHCVIQNLEDAYCIWIFLLLR